MKHLEIYADGNAFPNKGSGMAVILVSLNNRWERSFSSGNLNGNQATLKALKFGLLSISNSYKDTPLKIILKNKYVKDILQKDKDGYYKMTPSANKEIVEEIRVILDSKKEVSVEDGKDNENSSRCRELISEAVKNDNPVDIRK